MSSELSLIRFGVLNFFHLLMTSQPFSPVSTKLILMVEALIKAEPELDMEMRLKIDFIKDNTNDKIVQPLSIIEYVVFNNIEKTRNFNREIDINGKSYNMIYLYKTLNEISSQLTDIVVTIAKKYSIDMPIISYGNTTKSTNIEI